MCEDCHGSTSLEDREIAILERMIERFEGSDAVESDEQLVRARETLQHLYRQRALNSGVA